MRLRWSCRWLGLITLLFSACSRSSNENQAHSVLNPPATEPGKSAPGDSTKKPLPATASGLSLMQGHGDLGDADYGEKKSTQFTVKNSSGKAITLDVTEKSCACAGIEIKPTEVPADGTAEVTLWWAPKLGQVDKPEEGKDKVTVRLQARDKPDVYLRLEAHGNVKPALHVQLPRGKLDFGFVDLGQLKSGSKELAAVVYTKDPARKGFTLTPKSSSPGLKIVPAEPERLGAADLARLSAVDGYRLNIRCGEGLPIGRFQEIIWLKSDVYPDRPLEVHVDGWVETGAVSVQPELAVSMPETIELAKGYKCPPLTVTLNFEPNRTLTLEKVAPAFLQVKLEKVKENVWRVEVQVPAGEEAIRKHLTPEQMEEYTVTGFDAGTLTFKTDHPLVPVLQIAVPDGKFKR